MNDVHLVNSRPSLGVSNIAVVESDMSASKHYNRVVAWLANS